MDRGVDNPAWQDDAGTEVSLVDHLRVTLGRDPPDKLHPSWPIVDAPKSNLTNSVTGAVNTTPPVADGPRSAESVVLSGNDGGAPALDFDDILPYIGEFGTYQIILFFLTAPFCFFLAFAYFSQVFITLIPEHWCDVPELRNATGLTVHQM